MFLGVAQSTTSSAQGGIRVCDITNSNQWLTYLITCDAGTPAEYRNLVMLVSVHCGTNFNIVIDVLDNNEQYITLKPDLWVIDDNYLYFKRQAGVIFSCQPIGYLSTRRLVWGNSFPSSNTEVTPIVKHTSQNIPSFYKDYNDINSLASGIDNPNLSRFSLQYGQALKVSFINTFSNATSMELEVIWSGTHSTIFVSQQMSYGIGYNPSFPLFYFDDANNDFYIKSSQQADISVFIKHPRSLTCQVVTAPDVTWNATRQISYTGS